jgi:hypothetical protein
MRVISLSVGGVPAVQVAEQGQAGRVSFGGDIAAARGAEVGHGLVSAREDGRPLVLRGEERRVPVLRAVRREPAMVGQDHERRQVLVQAPERVAHPAAGPRKAGRLKAGGLQQRGRTVDARLAHHVVDERDVIDTCSQVPYDLAQQLAAPPMKSWTTRFALAG